MAALERIFYGYYEERLQGERPDPVNMQEVYQKISNMITCISIGAGQDIMGYVSVYGMEAEKAGYIAGFKMAWELLMDLQENG